MSKNPAQIRTFYPPTTSGINLKVHMSKIHKTVMGIATLNFLVELRTRKVVLPEKEGPLFGSARLNYLFIFLFREVA